MKKSKLQLLVKLATIFAVTLVMAMLVMLVFQYVSLNNLKTDEQALNNQLNQLVESRQNYETELAYMENNQAEFIEDYVREVLGWGRENEIQFTSS